ncbi:hypothetical protein HPB49_007522 [Dermacentor silvarum]|uniref:Uncharacterized protein n=1 Tax=Dermacentor silvarum TaxID=543639 RepID=A0ACB8DBL8_DERSI|nr:hypothetical protein HPB49_007522 [Dermacentor silvarum]
MHTSSGLGGTAVTMLAHVPLYMQIVLGCCFIGGGSVGRADGVHRSTKAPLISPSSIVNQGFLHNASTVSGKPWLNLHVDTVYRAPTSGTLTSLRRYRHAGFLGIKEAAAATDFSGLGGTAVTMLAHVPLYMQGLEDCTLRTEDGGAFRAHKELLSARSPFFQELLQGGESDVIVGGISAPVLGVILRYLYTDKLSLTTENVMDTWAAADLLLIDDCDDKCHEFVKRNVSLENCLSLLPATKQDGWPRYQKFITGFVLDNFDKIWRVSMELPDISVQQLCDLLRSAELNVPEEKTLLYAIARWSNAFDEGAFVNRRGLQQVLESFRVGLCNRADLEEFGKECPALCHSLAYRKAVLQAFARGPSMCTAFPILANYAIREPSIPVEEAAAAGVAALLAYDIEAVAGTGADTNEDADMEAEYGDAGMNGVLASIVTA